MPSPRRVRLLLLSAVTIAFFIFFYTSRLEDAPRDPRTIQDFYHKTVNAMGEKKPPEKPGSNAQGGSGPGSLKPADRDRDGDIDADDELIGAEMQERLKAAEARAKVLANEKAGLRPDPPSDVVGVGSAADGQEKKEAEDTGSGKSSSPKKDPKVSEETRDTEAELNSILKKSPTIIFSKTYCPYSKRAKRILLDKYSLTPEPHVVELDGHPLGSNLQDALKERTGRRTVPNILINGVSIGGADEVEELEKEGSLVDKIHELGSKRVGISLRSSRGSQS